MKSHFIGHSVVKYIPVCLCIVRREFDFRGVARGIDIECYTTVVVQVRNGRKVLWGGYKVGLFEDCYSRGKGK